jgi:hypothetical protein
MAGSLLSPRFSSATGNFSASLGFLCALALCVQVLHDSQMYQVFLDVSSEYCIADFHRSDFLATHIIN